MRRSGARRRNAPQDRIREQRDVVDTLAHRGQMNRKRAAALAATGSLTGLMTGMLGVGGGFIIVPMMRKLTDVSMHGIVATSLMVIALVGSGGVLATATHGATLPPEVALWFTGATATGMLSGRLASHHIAARQVQLGFASILVCVALALLVKAALM